MKGEYIVKKRLAALHITLLICTLVVLFVGANSKKPLHSKVKNETDITETQTEVPRICNENADSQVMELTPIFLKDGVAFFSEISDPELNETLAIKKNILNAAVLHPQKTNHPILDAMIEQRFSVDLQALPDTFSKAKYCYDWLLKNGAFGGGTVKMQDMYVFLGNCDYCGADGTLVYDAYRMLLTGQGVCDNFASALTVLFRYIGLEAYPVHGKAVLSDGTITNHVWVAVQTEGQFYFFDAQIENAAYKDGRCQYNLFCTAETAVPFYTAYDLKESVRAYHGFSLCTPLQAVCKIASVSTDPILYFPGDVNAYGAAVKSAELNLAVEKQEIPIEITVNGGVSPYRCTIKSEFTRNGEKCVATIQNTEEITNQISAIWSAPSNAENTRFIIEITDSEGRNLVCILL